MCQKAREGPGNEASAYPCISVSNDTLVYMCVYLCIPHMWNAVTGTCNLRIIITQFMSCSYANVQSASV